MPKYRYQAKNPQGRKLTGTIIAQNENDAVGELRKQNLTVLSVKPEGAKGFSLAGLFQPKAPRPRVKSDDLVVFKYEDQGVSTLEDGMYVLEDSLSDPTFVDKMVRFVRASMRGWKWAEENPDDAADIVLENDATGAQTEKHQRRMMGEIAKLTAGSNGALDPADYERTVDTLLKGGSDPVITKAPEGAWTHAITDKAL